MAAEARAAFHLNAIQEIGLEVDGAGGRAGDEPCQMEVEGIHAPLTGRVRKKKEVHIACSVVVMVMMMSKNLSRSHLTNSCNFNYRNE